MDKEIAKEAVRFTESLPAGVSNEQQLQWTICYLLSEILVANRKILDTLEEMKAGQP